MTSGQGIPHTISVVIPVYRGASTLPGLVQDISSLARPYLTPEGHEAQVSEVILVHDRGPDESDTVMRRLQAEYPFVRTVWLSRNYGQHAATLAGMASSTGEWIATIDEDGLYPPGQIGRLLDAAIDANATLVYADPDRATPASAFRNVTSRGSKAVIDIMTGSKAARNYHSFRLVLGDVGRSVANYAGSGVYLDVALGWVAGNVVTAPVTLREEVDRPSGYNLRRLLSHFWSMVLSSGTRGLRIVSATGFVFAVIGIIAAIVIVIQRLTVGEWPPGLASIAVALLLLGGIILLSLGIIAEYIGVAVNQAMGKPPFLVIPDPQNGPLGRERQAQSATYGRPTRK